ncbi:MAG: hypothetical protein LM582_09745 [Desulfurococcaceae archaeon]|nr:hypothetical protein [Desulfurococcaceae archaeon]
MRTRKLSYSEAVDFLSKGFAEVGITISREEIEDVVREFDGIIGWVFPRRLPVDSCKYLWIYFSCLGVLCIESGSHTLICRAIRAQHNP